MEEKGKLAVIVPWDSAFIWTAPAFNMMNWERPDDYEVRFFMGCGWCPAARHNDGVLKAQEWGADIIMFNGADHLCPKDIIPRMLKRMGEGWDMVHAVVPSRGVCGASKKPFQGMSYKVVGPMNAESPMTHSPSGSVQIITDDMEPQETHITGTGNIMMKAEILDGLEKPYFEEHIKKDGRYSRFAVQDSNFVYRCTILSGAKLFSDTSIKLVHLDVFGIDQTFRERFKDKEGQMDWSPAKDLRTFV